MKIKTFTKRQEDNGGICYFCEANLADYLEAISTEYNQYDIQRGFVENVFLDTISDSVKENKFIPPIVLVLKSAIDLDATTQIESGNFNILDGLQRTIRLKKLYEATKFLENEQGNIIGLNPFRLKVYFQQKHSKDYLTEGSYIVKAQTKKLTLSDFKTYKQWFEIWSHLDKPQQIEKMILLNAGHKSMDLKHQLELIFLTSLEINKFNDDKCIKPCQEEISDCEKPLEKNKCQKDITCIIHSKDISTRTFYSKKRKYDVHFTLFLDAIIALEKKEPFTIDQKSLVSLQENHDDYETLKLIINEEAHIESLIKFFKSLDDLFCDEFGEKGLEFLGRESVVIGFFAALGNYVNFQDFSKSLLDLENKIKEHIKKFDIDAFETMKKQVDITAFNIGMIMKETVFYLTKSILKGRIITFNLFPVSNPEEYREFIQGLKNESN